MQIWLPVIPKITPTAIIDILAVAILVYNFALVMRGRRAGNILSGLSIIGLVYGIAVLTHLELLRSVLAALVPYTAIALIVMFQSELRRMLARIGRSRWLGTRHRAAIGITEETDALAIIVSEETGQIALAFRGDIEPDVTVDRVREMILRHSGRQSGLRTLREPELKRADS